MNIIKYKAYIFETGKVHNVLSLNLEKQCVIVDMGYADIDKTCSWEALFYFKDIILIEFTNMFDISGKAIYTYDVIQTTNEIKTVLRTDTKYNFRLTDKPKVISNIFNIKKEE